MSNKPRSFRSAFDGFGRELLDGIHDVGEGHKQQSFRQGFDAAKGICVGLVAKDADALLAKVTGGGEMSREEQQLLAKLTSLKREMLTALDAFFAGPEPTERMHD